MTWLRNPLKEEGEKVVSHDIVYGEGTLSLVRGIIDMVFRLIGFR